MLKIWNKQVFYLSLIDTLFESISSLGVPTVLQPFENEHSRVNLTGLCVCLCSRRAVCGRGGRTAWSTARSARLRLRLCKWLVHF